MHCPIFPHRRIFILLLTGLALYVLVAQLAALPGFAQPPTPVTHQGQTYLVEEGRLLELDQSTGATRFIQRIFDPDEVARAYEMRRQIRYRVVGENAWPVIRNLSFGFENVNSIIDLIKPETGWSSLTLQGPKAPSVADYVSLRKKILAGQSDFLDNRVEPSRLRSYSGEQSLRLEAMPPSRAMALTKASLDSELLYFTQGDDFWFSGWFFIQSGTPTSLLDLESSFILNGPGMRVMVSPDRVPRLELKWADKPSYRQNISRPVRLPLQKWFNLRIHFYLSSAQDGRAQLWVDGELVISGAGQTLPLADTVLDRLELGITANPPGSQSVLFVDDVQFSDRGW
ncbi:MAG: hypothetical protein GXP05_07800 [Alphaproteobacteria bacterium]|nr:hypothetical protein [Alphaproteobacteria bacterium]